MVLPILLFVSMLAGDRATDAPVPEPAEINLTLDQFRNLTAEARAAHLNAMMADGYLVVDRFMTNVALSATYRSPPHAAGPGLCRVTEVGFFWWVATDRPRSELPPPDAGSLPLRREDGSTRSIFRRVDGPGMRSARLERTCARIDRRTGWVGAPSAEAFLSAQRILAAVQRELRRRPVTLDVDCRGWPDCRDRVLRTSFHDLRSVSECMEWDSRPPPPNCLRFNLPETHGPTMFATIGFEVDVDPGERIHIRRLRWRAMMHTN